MNLALKEIKEVSTKELKKFGLLVGGILVAIFSIAFPGAVNKTSHLVMIGAGSVLIFLSLVRPKLLALPYKIWMLVGKTLGSINSRLILGAIFLVIITPLGFFKRLFSRDFLDKRPEPALKSYKVFRTDSKINMKAPF